MIENQALSTCRSSNNHCIPNPIKTWTISAVVNKKEDNLLLANDAGAQRVVSGAQPVDAAADQVLVDLGLAVDQPRSQTRVRLLQQVDGPTKKKKENNTPTAHTVTEIFNLTNYRR